MYKRYILFLGIFSILKGEMINFYTDLFKKTTIFNKQKINSDSKFILITSLYNEKNNERAEEYIECIHKNYHHPLIDKIIVFYDFTGKKNTKILNVLKKYNDKIKIVNIAERLSFTRAFLESNTLSKGTKVIIANGDIYFNDTLFLLEKYDLKNKFLALTRWNQNKRGDIYPFFIVKNWGKNTSETLSIIPLEHTQDAWIFETPVNIKSNDIKLGHLGCDGRLAYEANKAGYKVMNPCKSVQACHIHNSNIRHWSSYTKENPRLDHIMMQVPWSFLDESE